MPDALTLCRVCAALSPTFARVAADNKIWLVMELCDGGELYERLMQQPGHQYPEAIVGRNPGRDL